MRQQGCAWLDAEAQHFFRCQDRDFRQLLGSRIFVDMGIDQYQLAVGQDQRIHRGVDIHAFATAQHFVDVVQMQAGGAVSTADHAVGIAFVDSHRTDQGMTAAHFQLGVLLSHALALGHRQEGLPVIAITGIEFRIDDFKIDACFQTQAETLDALLQHRWTANQDRPRQVFIDHHLHCAQDAFFFAFSVDDPLFLGRGLLGDLEQRPHEGAAAINELLQLVDISVHILDRTAGDAGRFCGLGDCRCNLDHQTRIERLWNDVFRSERQIGDAVGSGDDIRLLGLRQLGDRMHHRNFHLTRDSRGAAIERAAENVREAQNVVNLVRIVRTASRHDCIIAYGLDIFRQDFRRRVSQRQHQRPWRHRLHHVLLEHAAGRQA